MGEETSISWLRTVTLFMPSSFEAMTLETSESESRTSGWNWIMFRASIPTCLKTLSMSQGATFIVSVAEKFPFSVKTTSTRGMSLQARPCIRRYPVASSELEHMSSQPPSWSLRTTAIILVACPSPRAEYCDVCPLQEDFL